MVVVFVKTLNTVPITLGEDGALRSLRTRLCSKGSGAWKAEEQEKMCAHPKAVLRVHFFQYIALH